VSRAMWRNTDKQRTCHHHSSISQEHTEDCWRRLSVFGHIHVARLTQGPPAHNALHCQVGLASGRSLGRDWRDRPGRSRARWTDQLRNDTGSVPATNLWRQAILRGHGGATRRPELVRDDDDDDDFCRPS